jgi:hypothetical protein
MKARTLLLAGLLGLALGAGVEAGMPKPVSLVDQVETSWSRTTPGLSSTKYQSATWGNRWWQTLGRVPVIMTPWVLEY